MPSYRIHRLRDHLRQPFRSAPHVSGAASVKPRDYTEPEQSIAAATPYEAFFALKDAGTPLLLGDLLESEAGELRIFKFVGFEEARWVLPESKPPESKPEDPPPPAPAEEPLSISAR